MTLPSTPEARPEAPWLQWQEDAIVLTLHLQPGAARDEIVGLHGDALKVRIQSPPVDGKANQALQRFLAELFAVPRQQVQLIQGETTRRKRVRVAGVTRLPAPLVIASH